MAYMPLSLSCRLNTREVRYKEKMVKARNKLIEQLIQRDPTYKAPAGALSGKKSLACEWDSPPQGKQKRFSFYRFIEASVLPYQSCVFDAALEK